MTSSTTLGYGAPGAPTSASMPTSPTSSCNSSLLQSSCKDQTKKQVPKGNLCHSATSGEITIYGENSLILRKVVQIYGILTVSMRLLRP